LLASVELGRPLVPLSLGLFQGLRPSRKRLLASGQLAGGSLVLLRQLGELAVAGDERLLVLRQSVRPALERLLAPADLLLAVLQTRGAGTLLALFRLECPRTRLERLLASCECPLPARQRPFVLLELGGAGRAFACRLLELALPRFDGLLPRDQLGRKGRPTGLLAFELARPRLEDAFARGQVTVPTRERLRSLAKLRRPLGLLAPGLLQLGCARHQLLLAAGQALAELVAPALHIFELADARFERPLARRDPRLPVVEPAAAVLEPRGLLRELGALLLDPGELLRARLQLALALAQLLLAHGEEGAQAFKPFLLGDEAAKLAGGAPLPLLEGPLAHLQIILALRLAPGARAGRAGQDLGDGQPLRRGHARELRQRGRDGHRLGTPRDHVERKRKPDDDPERLAELIGKEDSGQREREQADGQRDREQLQARLA
jgi:hypothetical protein